MSSSAASPLVKVTQANPGLAIVEMQSGPVNALSLAHMHALRTTIQELEADSKCNAMILTSARKGIFSAGLDMSEFYNPESIDIVRAFWREFQELFVTLYGSRLATVAALNGHCPAGE
jgi:3,2-trans-enoyl-CoA isomerase